MKRPDPPTALDYPSVHLRLLCDLARVAVLCAEGRVMEASRIVREMDDMHERAHREKLK